MRTEKSEPGAEDPYFKFRDEVNGVEAVARHMLRLRGGAVPKGCKPAQCAANLVDVVLQKNEHPHLNVLKASILMYNLKDYTVGAPRASPHIQCSCPLSRPLPPLGTGTPGCSPGCMLTPLPPLPIRRAPRSTSRRPRAPAPSCRQRLSSSCT